MISPLCSLQALEAQKGRVQKLQCQVSECKLQYSRSLHNLEDISESIHEQRRKRRHLQRKLRQLREPGVGEASQLPSFDLDECDLMGEEERAAASGASSSARGSVDLHEEDVEDQVDGVKVRECKLFAKTASSSLGLLSISARRSPPSC